MFDLIDQVFFLFVNNLMIDNKNSFDVFRRNNPDIWIRNLIFFVTRMKVFYMVLNLSIS